MQCSVEVRIKIKIETSFKLCSNTTLLISGATAGLVYARNGPLQQVANYEVSHCTAGRNLRYTLILTEKKNAFTTSAAPYTRQSSLILSIVPYHFEPVFTLRITD